MKLPEPPATPSPAVPRTAGASDSALFLTPEAPYPMTGGGALRSASLLEWLMQHYAVDVVTFGPLEATAVREVMELPLPPNARHLPARAWRNLSRQARGVPPLVDRFGGFENVLRARLEGRRYSLGVIEHFWCAPYVEILRSVCDRLVLDLHNIESELHGTGAAAASWPVSIMLSRFAGMYRKLERELLPKFDAVLVTSPEDALRARSMGASRIVVYPNALPLISRPVAAERHRIVFSGNLEYHPNQSAARWFRMFVWPQLRDAHPALEWWLVGKNPKAVAAIVGDDPRIRLTGAVEDAVAVLAEAKVCVVPIVEGSGTRFKILEAWAAGRAVVSTTLGAEGLGGRDGIELLLADKPTAMIAAVSKLLGSEALRQALGDSGRARYEEHFTWPVAWKQLKDL